METQVLIPALPNELSFEILLRLPVNSLLKFITISKTWNSLIRSSRFIKSHLLASLSNPNFSHHHLLYSLQCCSTNAHHFPLSSVLNCRYIIPQDVAYPAKNPIRSPWLIGSINGLVCIATDESETELILWNPCIRKSRTLPYLDVDFEHHCSSVYGFGYHSCGEDYKVFAIFCVLKNYGYENEVKVYSQKSDSWKNMEAFMVGLPLDVSGVFVDGKLHWAITPCFNEISESSYTTSIITIDVGDESYGKLDQPDYGDGEFSASLGVLGKCLCVLCNYFDRVDFWVMEEYGVKESWTKHASLPELDFDRLDVSSNRGPLCLLKNGNILFMERNKTRFILYNPKDGSHRHVWLLNGSVRYHEALIYVESFVLP